MPVTGSQEMSLKLRSTSLSGMRSASSAVAGSTKVSAKARASSRRVMVKLLFSSRAAADGTSRGDGGLGEEAHISGLGDDQTTAEGSNPRQVRQAGVRSNRPVVERLRRPKCRVDAWNYGYLAP